MSLIFDVTKDKNISMVIETSGIEDTNKLEFTFNIMVNGIKYGFPCELDEGKVNICIPALSEVVKGLKTGKYKASLDVTGDKNYFLQPFNEEVELMSEPKVDVIVDDESSTNMVEAITASISNIIDDDKEVNGDKSKSFVVEKNDDGNSVVNKMFD